MKITKDNLQQILEGLDYIVESEFKFCDKKKFRSDWKISKGNKSVFIEYEGIDPTSGRNVFHKDRNGMMKRDFRYAMNGHTSPLGYTKDCEKYNLCSLMGFFVLRYTIINLDSDILRDLEMYFN